MWQFAVSHVGDLHDPHMSVFTAENVLFAGIFVLKGVA